MTEKKPTKYYMVIGAIALDIDKDGVITILDRYKKEKLVLDEDGKCVFAKVHTKESGEHLLHIIMRNRVFLENRRRELFQEWLNNTH